MGVVLGEPADSRHAPELARLLVAVDGAELGQPQGQVLVAVRPGLVDHRVMRAVHRLEQVLLVVAHRDRLELAVGVVRVVARDLVEVDLADVRGVDRLVAAGGEFLPHEGFERAPQDRPLGHPEHEPRADERARGEQIELLAEDAMVAAPGLLERREVGVELLLGEPGGAVEPLQLGVVGVPLPVGPRDVRELEGADAAGARHVGAAAEVDELPLPVERQRRMGGEPDRDVLGLERLVESADDLDRLLPRHLDPLEGLVGGDDPPHLLLDGRQVLVGDRPGGPHVIVEAVAGGGPEGQFHVREEPHHRPGHDVGGGMPHHRQRPGVAREQRLDRHGPGGGQRHVEAHGMAVEQGGDRPGFFLRRGLRHRGVADDVGQAGRGGIVTGGAVGEADVGHGGAGGPPEAGRLRSRFRKRHGERSRRGAGVARRPGGGRPRGRGRLTATRSGARLCAGLRGRLAQLVRALARQARGHRFESYIAH